MTLFSVKTANSIGIYRSASSTRFLILGLASLCAFLGLAFLFISYDRAALSAFFYFGLAFLGGTGLTLAAFPKIQRRLAADGGYLTFFADDKGLRLNALVTSVPAASIEWDQVEKICVAEKYFDRDSEGSFESRNYIIIFFCSDISDQGWFKNLQNHRSRSPEGQLFDAVPFPRAELAADVRDKIHEVTSGRVRVELCKEVRFDSIAKIQKIV